MSVILKPSKIKFKDPVGGGYVGINAVTDQSARPIIQDWLDNHPEATTTVQDGSLTESKFSNTLKLKTIKDYVTPEMFGAVGDGTTDDTQAWKDAIDSGKIIVAVGNYKCTEELSLDNNTYIYGIIYNEVSNGVSVSGKNNKEYIISVSAKSDKDTEYVGVKVQNCNGCKFNIKSQYFYTGIKFLGASAGCCYNKTDSIFVVNSKYALLLENTNSGWVNENYFYNARLLRYSGGQYAGEDYGIALNCLSSNHAINSNKFTNFSVEGLYCGVSMIISYDNTVRDIRTEGCTYAAIFDDNSGRNLVAVAYGVTNSINPGDNYVYNFYIDYYKKFIEIANSGSLASDTASNTNNAATKKLYRMDANGNVSPQLLYCTSVANGIKRTSGSIVGFLINVENGKKLLLRVNSSGGYFRPAITPYDSNGDFIDGATIKIETNTLSKKTLSYFDDYYSTGSNTNGNYFPITLPSGVTTCFVGIVFMDSDMVLHSLSVFGDVKNYEAYNKNKLELTNIPTSNGYYYGQEVYSTSSNKKWVWDGTNWNETQIFTTYT